MVAIEITNGESGFPKSYLTYLTISNVGKRRNKMIYRCMNDIFSFCNDNTRWDKETEEERAIIPVPDNTKIEIVHRCELNPNTCGRKQASRIPNISLRKEIRKLDAETAQRLGLALNRKKNSKKKSDSNEIEIKQGSLF